jgi:hypothetical protein
VNDNVAMALNRLKLLEDDIEAGVRIDEAYLRDFCFNMRLRLEHGTPGETIACFAMGFGSGEEDDE